MKKWAAVFVMLMLCAGCQEHVSEMVCQHDGGIKSWHAHDDHLEVTCDNGTIYNIDWL